MSEGSFGAWSRMKSFSRFLLSQFDSIVAQSRLDAERFTALGASKVQCLGNLKYDAPPLPCDDGALERLGRQIGARPVWLAASTHPGEEQLVAMAHQKLATAFPDILTVIVPRHAVRGPAIASMLLHDGSVALRSADESIDAGTAFYIADTMGELGLFYRLCQVAFIGGSLVPHGGQNVIEPAMLGCAIVVGPHMENFVEVMEEFRAAGALMEVDSSASLADSVGMLLRDKNQQQTLSHVAAATAARYRGLTAQLADALTKLLAS